MTKSNQFLLALISIYATVVAYGFYLVKSQIPVEAHQTVAEQPAQPTIQAIKNVHHRLTTPRLIYPSDLNMQDSELHILFQFKKKNAAE
ncbi:hypothetical protein VINI7043_10941 [Vibrio nigripulchritudo ATCC 27043]|uniref:hypothetical protein n=1 Tax=Vibrio nigripulchritudo TaxID=28173 RepID=UPI00021C1C3C|nr:hypothetical protein [Vibrio nigripulchritudo]EGU55624.1 hypothetical protein VINI7043_10941 [Vibrio nigripulchritudo ATCC 27043]